MQRLKLFSRIVLGLFFILAGINHFRRPRVYEAIMPPYLPRHRLLVALSGYAEVLLGVLVLVPRMQLLARRGLVALLLAVFPANVYMALNPQRYRPIPAWALWLRLPLQGVLIAWVRWSTVARTKHQESRTS